MASTWNCTIHGQLIHISWICIFYEFLSSHECLHVIMHQTCGTFEKSHWDPYLEWWWRIALVFSLLLLLPSKLSFYILLYQSPSMRRECWVASVESDSTQPYGLCSSPGFSIHGILQARILEWVTMPSSRRESSQPRAGTCISDVSCTGRQVLYH